MTGSKHVLVLSLGKKRLPRREVLRLRLITRNAAGIGTEETNEDDEDTGRSC